MFKIDSINFPDLQIRMSFEDKRQNKPNLLSILTGPNGSGKTEILYRLASIFGRVGKIYDLDVNEIFVNSSGSISRQGKMKTLFDPNVVITQTFSPFSRFPQLPKNESSKYLSYKPIGLFRGKNWSSQAIAKDIVIQSLIELSDNPDKARTYSDTLEYLGYHSSIKLEFSSILPTDFFSGLTVENAERRFTDYLVHLDKTRKNFSQQKILREIDKENGLGDVLDHLIIVSRNGFSSNTAESINSKTNIVFDFNRLIDDLPTTLRRLIRLREYGLFRLNSCEIESKIIKDKKIDLSEASSGEQQIICSIFGILSAIKSNSLVLIDEPEISLHPKWQLKFIELLENALKAFKGCHVIISTHSALIVQSAQTAGHQVISMASDNDDNSEVFNDSKPSVEQALVEVFETPIPRSAYISNRILELITSVEEESLKQNALTELERYLKIYSKQVTVESDRTQKLLRDAITIVSKEVADE